MTAHIYDPNNGNFPNDDSTEEWVKFVVACLADPNLIIQVLSESGWGIHASGMRALKAHLNSAIEDTESLESIVRGMSKYSRGDSASTEDIVPAILGFTQAMCHANYQRSIVNGEGVLPSQIRPQENLELIAHGIIHQGGIATLVLYNLNLKMVVSADYLSRTLRAHRDLIIEAGASSSQVELIEGHYVFEEDRNEGDHQHSFLLHYIVNPQLSETWYPSWLAPLGVQSDASNTHPEDENRGAVFGDLGAFTQFIESLEDL